MTKSTDTAAKVLHAALCLLKENGGSLPVDKVIQLVESRVVLDEHERERYAKTGYVRWQSILSFCSVVAVKAGYLVKGGGSWSLTPAGEQATSLNPEDLHEAADEGYRIWRNQNPKVGKRGATSSLITKTHTMNEAKNELSEIEFEEQLEDDEEPQIEEPARRIYTDQMDPEVESLYNKYKKGKLDVQPGFQRHFVWDATKSSRLIESALLDIPLPVVYLSEENDGKESVIDGQQRLTAFFSFIDGRFPSGSDFKLTGLKVFRELNKKTFKELDETKQDKIRHCPIRTIRFRRESQSDLKFEVFERLNSGSVSLNDQELRNCMYRGPYIELLKDLSHEENFRYLLGITQEEKRMRDVELVLRFAAFYHQTYLKYKAPMKKFLNSEMEHFQKLGKDEADKLRAAFKNATSTIRSLLDLHAFKRFYRGDEKNPDGRWEEKAFNASLYDVLMWSFATTDRNQVQRNLDAIREALINLMAEDQIFIDSIELSTSSLVSISKRFDKWRSVLNSVLESDGAREPRLFTLALKQELFKTSSTCGICNQNISHIDDAAVDHVEQYWQGGRTIPENARLAHRYCNWSRPRKENEGSR